MANLFTRIAKAVKTEIDVTFKEKDIKPGELFNDFLKTCEVEIAKIEALIKRQDQITTRFHKERDEAASIAKKRRRQGEIAAKANEADLEKRAIDEAIYYEGLAQSLDEKCEKAQKELENLRNSLNETKKKVKEVNLNQLEEISKENIAHISQKIKEAYERFTQPIVVAKEDDLDDIISDLEKKQEAKLDEDVLLLEPLEETEE